MYCSNIDMFECYACLFGCLCGALWLCPVDEFYVVVKKQFFVGYEPTEEGSKFKASIAWDCPCCSIHL